MAKQRALLNLGLALILAVVAGYGAMVWMQSAIAPSAGQQAQADKPAQQAKQFTIAVAAAAVARGTKIEPNLVKFVPYFEDSAPQGHFTDMQSVHGRVLAQSMAPGEPILESKLAPKDVTTGGVGAIVTPGKRAVAVKGNKVMGLAGHIKPGDAVDVLASFSVASASAKAAGDSEESKERQITKVVLENIIVLAAGAELQKKKEGSGAEELMNSESYTLEVTPEEAELLMQVATNGTLSFALRNPADTHTVWTKGADMAAAAASYAPFRKPTEEGAPQQPSVEAIRGGKVERVNF